YRNDSYKEKRYSLKLDKSTDFLALVKDLNIKGVSKIDIGSTTNAQLQELRKEVKIMAVQAAKDKATYLLESIGEKPGRVLAVEEVSDYGYNNYSMSKQSNMVAQTTPSGEEIENLATIKLRFEIKAKFEIAE
ncbi:MAG TPA: SIMPL domain-containing protein, partial [Saprospiraceae bacterium]